MAAPTRPSPSTARAPPWTKGLAAVMSAFPGAQISYQVDVKRQTIVDSWPEDVDDSAARREWHFAPGYDFERTFHEYLLPTIRAAYK